MRKHFKTISVIAASFAVIFSVQSCKKETGNQPPVIELQKPTANTVIEAGNALHIQGTVTDEDALHEGRIQLSTATETLWDTAFSVHGMKSHHFHEHFHTHVSDTTHATFKISFSDHDENVATKEVSVTFLP